MTKKLIILIPLALAFATMQAKAFTEMVPGMTSFNQEVSQKQLLAQHGMSLNDRYPVPSVNSVFRDNILLTLAYLSGTVKNPSQINWNSLHKSYSYEMVLQPNEVFAFHADVLPEFAQQKIITTNAQFDNSQGFRSDGYLYGDGVCHFASLINWVARDAGLEVVAPVNHDFAVIPGINRQYGTAIYYAAGDTSTNEAQNLYVKNTYTKPVDFYFTYANNELAVSVYK